MLEKTYDPNSIEQKYYAAHEKAGHFACHPQSGKDPYCIMIPPPNVTGSLHMGHALTFTIQDILIRFHRRLGRDTLWMPGTDHAGIATQMVVERQLAEQKITRHDLGREKFLEKVWQWKEQSGGTIVSQLKRLGASADWPRARFTMDEGLSHAVRHVFVELYRQGLIYKDKRLVNWDPKLQTAISDLEVEQRQTKGKMWHLKYPIVGEDGFIVIATTRPETMLGGDAAVAVHPDDDRYKHLIGKKVKLPMVDAILPIIADDYVDREKGTGAVKISPGHDFNDFEVGKRHNLPLPNIFDKTAHLNDLAPKEYRGLDRFKAREKFIAEMESHGLLQKIEDNAMVIPHGDRSGVVIEPWLTDQWYCDAATLAKPAIQAVEQGKMKFVPEQWVNTYNRWMENIQPWCISRQLWWGHQIPAWYGPDDHVIVAMDEAEANQQAQNHYGKKVALTRDPDVLDTWFSSALWPMSTLGWENGADKTADWKEMQDYFPTDVLVTGFDIIFFWVARMMMMSLHFTKEVPFREVYIHALVRDASGQKMSKSKGNIIDPLTVMEKYGCDALRFTLAALSVPGRDIKLSEQRVDGYRSFATKLWNAARYAEMNECVFDPAFDPGTAKISINKWIVAEIISLEKDLRESMPQYRFDLIAEKIYHGIWGNFCDWYLEFTKPILLGDNETQKSEVRKTTAWALAQFTHMLNPLMPFITEELAEKLNLNGGKALIISQWPDYASLSADTAAQREVAWLIELIGAIRSTRAGLNISPAAQLKLLVKDASAEAQVRIKSNGDVIAKIARLSGIEFIASEIPKGSAVHVIEGATLILPIADLIDLNAERARLQKEMKKLQDEITHCDTKLGNPNFVERAAAEAVDEIKTKRHEAGEALDKLQHALGQLTVNG